ncbi:unnamed protein product [Peronospora belbahrii]|uniref:BZIP domain-containing protein n=1 Tax=Peronospora belbahrii TaxID=622444 RepID=A0AAU9L8J8_9STRA|nr:unnamed protein product [Peronospora belbahrii]CAH0514428.1 unnamed protein product [Peronospora belbahrii]
MTMTSTMEWEAPIPAWIDSINIDIDIDEIPVPDLMVSIPDNMDDIPLPCTPKVQSFFTCSTELHSPLGPFIDNVMMLETESRVETKCSIAPSLSPVKSKPIAKPARRTNWKVSVGPSGRDQRRKDKQRGYETNYRKRQKAKRERDQAEWVQLETQLRKMLVKRTTYTFARSTDNLETTTSTEMMRLRYVELLHEERALRESEALDNCVWAETRAMTFWGGANSKTRDIREQMNTLPSLRGCHTFEFTW